MTTDPTLAEAAAVRWEAIVVGAGIGGTVAALGLVRAGRRVLLVERARFPRQKVCGGCLNPRALAALDAVGVGDAPGELGASSVKHFSLLHGGRRRLTVPLRSGGVAVTRGALDALLWERAAAAGVARLGGATVRKTASEADARALRVTAAGEEATLRADVVIGAGGLSCPIAREIGTVRVAPTSKVGCGIVLDSSQVGELPRETVLMAVGRGGYVGLVAAEDGYWILAAALDPRLLAGTRPAQACAAILASAGLPLDLPAEGWSTCPALMRQADDVVAERALLVGDSAGYARALAAGWSPAAAAAYARFHARDVRGRQRPVQAAAWCVARPAALAVAASVPFIGPTLGAAAQRWIHAEAVPGS